MMACENCLEHSQHATMIELHEKRHNAHDKEFNEVKSLIRIKVSRWVFILFIGILNTAALIQIATLKDVSKTLGDIDKKVAVLYDRDEQRKEDQGPPPAAGPGPEKTAFLITGE